MPDKGSRQVEKTEDRKIEHISAQVKEAVQGTHGRQEDYFGFRTENICSRQKDRKYLSSGKKAGKRIYM